ncbi:DUF262 domain-containing protein [Catenovulum sp. 2E275]|uniref:DUF262 domain-containing protein n=1 Tax=Catenovulum sp. 2E275 TaxID=2980497 RepID=UPI0021D2C610|nr:DUF262 domain-containing protein [Catenovulum sp. 2E275]MCU4676037.1 DUF262 domain-containing protein [Catenovulum sp. 2E275]
MNTEFKTKLHPNESLKINSPQQVKLNDFDKKKANDKYIAGEVRIITEQARYPLNTILSMVKSEDYILNPEFQRRHRWDVTRKSRLIESFIMNVPIPPIFLYEIEYSTYEVMDGLQRLTAISQFYKNEYALSNLTEWKELNGLTYEQLPEQIRKGIDRRYISSIILLQETAKDKVEAARLKQLVFERINSGGEKLKSQEIRNALYPGDLNSLCIKMARDKYFCKLWQIPEPDAHEISSGEPREEVINNIYYKDMSDVELCLRFVAYRQLDKMEGNTMEIFLDSFLKAGNEKFDIDTLNHIKTIFESTTKLAYEIFGIKAFWMHRKRSEKGSAGQNSHWYQLQKPTKVLYDPLMQVLSNLLDHSDKLIEKKDAIVAGTQKLHQDNLEIFAGRDTNKNDVIRRVNILREYFGRFI